ncbi:hypothetical protein GYMLUDRAFT_36992 [Collybiopsis luxurians FD-317 M1]|nr:hypothetical protein GYMLUDRAFT_36992 [Collybiopsis luxurians FD-317 M1]
MSSHSQSNTPSPSPRSSPSPPSPSTPTSPQSSIGDLKPTNYSRFVTIAFLNSRKRRGEQATVDQDLLRRCLSLSSSYLVADTCTNVDGINTWYNGFNTLIETLVALHKREELELETMNAASKACSECWSVSGAWKGLEGSRDGVTKAARKLKALLDENERTYRGQRVYAP